MSENFRPERVDVATVRKWLGGTGEVAFLDVREEGQHGAGHPLLAVNAAGSNSSSGNWRRVAAVPWCCSMRAMASPIRQRGG